MSYEEGLLFFGNFKKRCAAVARLSVRTFFAAKALAKLEAADSTGTNLTFVAATHSRWSAVSISARALCSSRAANPFYTVLTHSITRSALAAFFAASHSALMSPFLSNVSSARVDGAKVADSAEGAEG